MVSTRRASFSHSVPHASLSPTLSLRRFPTRSTSLIAEPPQRAISITIIMPCDHMKFSGKYWNPAFNCFYLEKTFNTEYPRNPSFGPDAGVFDHFAPLHDFGFDVARELGGCGARFRLCESDQILYRFYRERRLHHQNVGR